MRLADKIKQLRLQKQMTQPGLAEKAGISKAYVYMLETGEMTNPSLEILEKITTALGTTIAQLLGYPRVAGKETPVEFPESLARFAKLRRRAGEPLSEDDLQNLARIQFRGKRPKTVEDWRYVFEFLKRTFPREQR